VVDIRIVILAWRNKVNTKNSILSLLILKLFQTYMSLFLLLNKKEDILKNVGTSQLMACLHWLRQVEWLFIHSSCLG